MPQNDHTREERGRLAHEIYERDVRGEVEPGQVGRFIALDVESGDYEMAHDELEASERLIERSPDAVAFGLRVGYSAAHGVGARPRRVEESTASFSLMGAGSVVWFETRGYGLPEAPSRGPDWLAGAVHAEPVGPWTGSFEGTVLHDELQWLLEQIEGSLGLPGFEIAFSPADPYLEFEARSFEAGRQEAASGTGRDAPRGGFVSVEGRLDHEPVLGTELRFDFVSDRTRLANTALGLRHVLATFPDRVTPGSPRPRAG